MRTLGTNIGNRCDKPLNWFRKMIYQLAELKPEQFKWSVTNGEGHQVYPYFNTDVIQESPEHDGFLHAREALSRLGPWGFQFLRHDKLRLFLEQALLSACMMRPIKSPTDLYNLPVSHNMAPYQYRNRDRKDPVCLLHYHNQPCEKIPLELLPKIECLVGTKLERSQ